MSYYEEEPDFEDEIPATTDELEQAIQELMPKLSDLSPEALRKIAERASQALSVEVDQHVRKEVKTLVLKACGAQLQELAKKHMQDVFAEVLVEKVIVSGDSWSQKEATIREVIQGEMKKALENLKSDHKRENYVKEVINNFLGKELQDIAKSAVSEFKKEVLQELTKESTQRLTRTIAKAIAGDTKLLSVLKAIE